MVCVVNYYFPVNDAVIIISPCDTAYYPHKHNSPPHIFLINSSVPVIYPTISINKKIKKCEGIKQK